MDTCVRDGCGHLADKHSRKAGDVADACVACDCGGMKKKRGHDGLDGQTRHCNVSDLFTLSARRITDEGYLVAPATLARTGVQIYRAKELGLDGDPNRVVRLLRPTEEVMDPVSLASFNRQPVTLGHPPKGVNAENWSKYAVGDIHDVTGKGDVVVSEMIVRAKAAVDAVMSGKAALSNGYAFELDLTPGKTPEGEEYDGIQRHIRGNHNAIVDTARGGPSLRIADGTEGTGERMATKKIIDGITLEFADDTQASVIEKVVGDAKAATKTACDASALATTKMTAAEARATAADAALVEEKAKFAKLVTDHATATAKLTADHATALAALQAQIPKPEQIEALAAERSSVIGDALVLVPELKPEGKSIAAIRAETLTTVIAKDGAHKKVVLRVIGNADIGKAEEVLVRAAFDAIAAEPQATEQSSSQSSVNDAAVARALTGRGTGGAQKIDARDLMVARMKNGGKPLASETAR